MAAHLVKETKTNTSIYYRYYANICTSTPWEKPGPCAKRNQVNPEQLMKYVTALKPAAISQDSQLKTLVEGHFEPHPWKKVHIFVYIMRISWI